MANEEKALLFVAKNFIINGGQFFCPLLDTERCTLSDCDTCDIKKDVKEILDILK
jgi:hypothetical protein